MMGTIIMIMTMMMGMIGMMVHDHDDEADDHDDHGDEADVSMNLLLSASWQSSMGPPRPPTDRWEY